MNLYALSVNHRVNPLGINSAEQPYFGWKLKSEKPNTMQAAYRLRIYADDTVCFDSGRVETACNAFVCGPDLLRPQTFYRWAVTVWDNHGENTTAESSFETSLSFKEWKADWMRTPRAYVQRKKGFGTQPPATLFDFCQKVRRTSNVPILFLTASDEEMNIIMGLDIGGDDYLTKPFKLSVLLSRVNALLRRANASSAGEPVLESGSITVRLLQGQAYKNGILLELTSAEYKLLCFFMQHPNAVLSKEQILDALWDCDGDYIDSSALTVYIRRLRMKIEDDPGKPQMLLTVRGMGYKWNG